MWRAHVRSKMHQENSFFVSKPEEALYRILCEKYGAKNVIRHYSDERYPYECDFYVVPIDLFVEGNFHPSHGKHPFDVTSKEDLLEYNRLKRENTKWSNMILSVWGKRDVEKMECAKNNNLNYIAVYDLSSFSLE